MLRFSLRDLTPQLFVEERLRLARELEQSSALSINFEKIGDRRRLQPTEELALYRIVQEALSNVIRHSPATRAMVNIRFTDQAVLYRSLIMGKGSRFLKAPLNSPLVVTSGS